MTSYVGLAHVTLYFDESFSLKTKRREIRSITERVRNRFNVSIAEVEDLNDMRVGTLALCCVSNSAAHSDRMMAEVLAFIERNVEFGVVGEISTEVVVA